jgi:hypothetical protein
VISAEMLTPSLAIEERTSREVAIGKSETVWTKVCVQMFSIRDE